MRASRLLVPSAVLAVVVVLSGCGQTLATPSPVPPPPSPTALSADALAERSLIGSTWTGIDSAGDVTTFTFDEDHTVAVAYNGTLWDEASDTWTLAEGQLTVHVHIDATTGELVYTAPYAEGAEVLDVSATSTGSARTLTVTLERQ